MGQKNAEYRHKKKASPRVRFEDMRAEAARCDGDLFLCAVCGRVFDGGGKEDDNALRYCRLCYKKEFT